MSKPPTRRRSPGVDGLTYGFPGDGASQALGGAGELERPFRSRHCSDLPGPAGAGASIRVSGARQPVDINDPSASILPRAPAGHRSLASRGRRSFRRKHTDADVAPAASECDEWSAFIGEFADGAVGVYGKGTTSPKAITATASADERSTR